jgi:hypothetical protein
MSSDAYTTLIVIGFLAVMCLGALVVLGLGYLFIIRPNLERTKVVNRNWESFAGEKGLTFVKGGYPAISGTYRGRPVKLAVVNPNYDFEGTNRIVAGRTARHNYMLTRASTSVNTAGFELMVYRRKGRGVDLMFDKRGAYEKFDSEQDLTTGNEAFDSEFRVHCSSPERVKSILLPEVQSVLLERITTLDLHANMLNLNAVGVESRPEVLEAFLELVCKIADKIENR